VCAIQGTLDIKVVHPVGIVFAADHGAAERGVSAYPREVTAQMVANFLHGGAAISVLARLQGVELWIVDAGVDGDLSPHPCLIEAKIRRGTRNFIDEPAMTPSECAEALQRGRDVVERVIVRGRQRSHPRRDGNRQHRGRGDADAWAYRTRIGRLRRTRDRS